MECMLGIGRWPLTMFPMCAILSRFSVKLLSSLKLERCLPVDAAVGTGAVDVFPGPAAAVTFG